MHTTTDYTALVAHAQRIEQAQQALARRVLVDEGRLLQRRGPLRALWQSLAERVVRRRKDRARVVGSRAPQRRVLSRQS
jgi:hypothetical protein